MTGNERYTALLDLRGKELGVGGWIVINQKMITVDMAGTEKPACVAEMTTRHSS